MNLHVSLVACCAFLLAQTETAKSVPAPMPLYGLTPGVTKAENALWIENPLTARFNSTNRVTVADIKGPAVITMIHFAMPQSHFGKPEKRLERELILRAYWDGETHPSIEAPMVDFFCDPNGSREEVNNAFVNKRRGWNAYFPMPFRRSARIELVYDGVTAPGEELWRQMPCYSYVMYRTSPKFSRDTGCFHASWRQQALLIGKEDYEALQAKGRGKVVGWNVSMRLPGRDGYPVDMNEKFYIDGEEQASIEFQGIEDSFGFSWGFPPEESQFPLTGFYKFMKGAMGYRFFVQDSISFERKLRIAVGFGVNEDPMFHRNFSKRGNTMQFSSTVYWYQTEPHLPFAPLPPVKEREPAPEQAFWPETEQVPDAQSVKSRGVKFLAHCGRKAGEVIYAADGYSSRVLHGFAYGDWPPPVYHCIASDDAPLQLEVQVPKGTAGELRLYIIDPDNFRGGRKERITIGTTDVGTFENFQEGRWVKRKLTSDETNSGTIPIIISNAREGSNVVVSKIEWVE